MKVGVLSCGTVILHGLGVLGSSIFSRCLILSCFMVCGGSPDCRMIVKNAFSRSGDSLVIWLISSFVICLSFKLVLPSKLVAFVIIKGVNWLIYRLWKVDISELRC